MPIPPRAPIRLARLLCAAALAGAGCGGGDAPRPPSVVLVTLDTVRADHLGTYGYPRATSPRLDELAREATRFASCRATAPWTVPTHASLFTGLFPFEHGAHSVPLDDASGGDNVRPLAPEHETLAEALAAEGYRTAAFVGNRAYLRPSLGLGQGFEVWDVAGDVPSGRGRAVNARALPWLRERAADGRPFLLFLNYMDAHRPYHTAPVSPALPVLEPDEEGELLTRFKQVVLGGGSPEPDLRRRVVDQYDLGVANADRALGELLDALRELGLYDRALVVVTSDHGEYLGEHALVEHSKDVYEPALRVPLVVKAPGQRAGGAPQVAREPVSSVDVPWLVLQRLPEPLRERLAARFPRAPGEHPVLAENHYSRLHDLRHPVWGARFDRVRTAIYSGPHKLIRSSDGAHELYDLARDPDELRDLLPERPAQAQEMAEALADFEARALRRDPVGRPAPAELSPEDRERMRELGYLGPAEDR